MTVRLVFAALWLLTAAALAAVIPRMWREYRQGHVRARVAYVWTGTCVTTVACAVALAAGFTGPAVAGGGLAALLVGVTLVIADLRRRDLP